MILHSIVSIPDIFCNTESSLPCREYRTVNGGILELEGGRIKRLISTDPAMYLDRRYMPDTEYKEHGLPAK